MRSLLGGSVIARLMIGAGLSTLVALFALARRSLDRSGAAAALAVGTGVYAGLGAPGFVALCVFFFGSSLLSKLGRTQKRALAFDYEKSDTRDALQVLANGAVACACALLALHAPALVGGFLGALGTAAGDTWATELGPLSKGDPLSLASFRRVPRGSSGAVSLLGVAASFAGGVAVALAFGAVQGELRLQRVLAVGLASTLGSLADSLLGAHAQARHYCDACQRPCEGQTHGCGAATRLVGGQRVMGNDLVNALATAVGACAGAFLA
jgi:uncharacterized protein (TIGR00297 family)